jgi:hypothetical protein
VLSRVPENYFQGVLYDQIVSILAAHEYVPCFQQTVKNESVLSEEKKFSVNKFSVKNPIIYIKILNIKRIVVPREILI